MLTRFRPQLTYANVVATAALVMAATGGAYAATQLPRNSVGPRQLRRSSVSSSKVKDRSLLSRDFKPGQLPLGPQGLQGPVGAQGLKGDKGDQGDRGPSDAFKATNDFGQLRGLPAGSYAINGKVVFSGGTGLATLRCDLVAGPATGGGGATIVDHSQASATTASGTTDLAIPLQALATFTEPQNLTTNCVGSAPGGTPTLNNMRLTAVQVGAIR